MLSWLKENTKIPVPAALYFDSSTDNILKRENIITTTSPGVPLSELYLTLTSEQLNRIPDQWTSILLELHSIPLHRIGGFRISTTSSIIVPGPACEKTSWQSPDIEELWPPMETFESLNIKGSYETCTGYITA